MDEHRNPELERLILEQPDDAARFLVYGDWLEERKARRGALMSVQHSLATGADAQTQSQLQLMERELIAHEELRLLAGGAGGAGAPPISLEWRLGFVTALSVSPVDDASAARAIEHLAADPAMVFLRHLTLVPRGRQLTRTWQAILAAGWDALSSLTCTGPFDWSGWASGAGLDTLPRLRRLAFQDIAGADDTCAAIGRWLPRLVELSITNSDLTMKGVDTLARARPQLTLLDVSGNELPMSAKQVLRALSGQLRFGRQRGDVGASLRRGLVLFDRRPPGNLIERTVVQVARHHGVRDVFLREASLELGGKPCGAIELLGATVPLDVVAESLARRAEFLPRTEKFRTLAVVANERVDQVQLRAFHDGGELFGSTAALEGPVFSRAMSQFLNATVGSAALYWLCDALDEAPPQFLLFRDEYPVPESSRKGVFESYFAHTSAVMSLPPPRVEAEPEEPRAIEDEATPCDFCGRDLPTWPCQDCEEMMICEACADTEDEAFRCPHCSEHESDDER